MGTHQELVNRIREIVDSLGLITLRMKSHLARGFLPDLQVMCGVSEKDRVIIDAINTKASLNRDIGALLRLKANYDRDGIPYRRIFAVCSDAVSLEDLRQSSALSLTNPRFEVLNIGEVKYVIREVAKEALREKLEQLNQEDLEFYFERACPKCGEYRNLRRIAADSDEWECLKCGRKWINPNG